MISTDGKPTVRSRAVRYRTWSAALVLLILVSGLLGGLQAVQAQEAGQVQTVTGTIRPGEFFWYLIPDLQNDQTLYVHMQGTSGNLDPIIGLVDGDSDTEALEESYTTAIQGAFVEGSDPLLAAEAAANDLFLVWDDDGGEGLAAAFSFPVPADGDYRLIVSNALSALGQATFGDYQLLIGRDAPQVLSGEAEPSGEAIAILDTQASSPSVAVEEFRGTLTEEKTKENLELYEVREGDTFSVFVEATSGDLRPALVLLNYADKPVRTANLNGKETSASLEYTVEDRGRGYAIKIVGCCGEEGSTGDYRLLVGVNAPDVLEGDVAPNDQTVIKEPIPV
ncbi:MAG: hypothetical protein WBD56_05565, partial [Anaerolineales bacterium]